MSQLSSTYPILCDATNVRSLDTISLCAENLQLVRGAARRLTARSSAPGHRTVSTAMVDTLHLTNHAPSGFMKEKLQK